MDLDEIERGIAKRPGPWRTRFEEDSYQEGTYICNDDRDLCRLEWDDTGGLLALLNAAPDLIAAARQRDRLLALLREIEDLDDARPCPICGYYGMNHEHLNDCVLARELTAGGSV